MNFNQKCYAIVAIGWSIIALIYAFFVEDARLEMLVCFVLSSCNNVLYTLERNKYET